MRRRDSSRNGRNGILILIIIIISISAGIGIAAMTWNLSIAEVKEIPMSFFVEGKGGINTDTDAVYFGSVPRGMSSSRSIHIEADEELMVTAMAIGNISSVVTISDNNFILRNGEYKTLKLIANAPKDDKYITAYTGTLRLVFTRF